MNRFKSIFFMIRLILLIQREVLLKSVSSTGLSSEEFCEKLLESHPYDLSGGEQQRAALVHLSVKWAEKESGGNK